MITPVDAFEEIRFVAELLLAELLFTFPVCKRTNYFWVKCILGFIVGISISFGYFLLLSLLDKFFQSYAFITQFIIGCWYVFLSCLSLGYLRLCFKMSFSEVVFRGIAGYALQHIEYALINEMLAIGLCPYLLDNFWPYIIISIMSCMLLYGVAYVLLADKFQRIGNVIGGGSVKSTLFYLLLYVVLIASTLMEQYMFHIVVDGIYNYTAALTDVLSCALILLVQYTLCRINQLYIENGIVERLFYENQKQYETFKETVDTINRKCHDLKHQIAALKNMSKEERDKSIDEIKEAVMLYDSVVRTENEVLNTILTEKSMYCESLKIRLSCVVDGAEIDFMNTIDIYTLFGNAIDNAIESVRQYEEEEKRVISLTVHSQGQFLSIQINNYFKGKLELKDGLPVTSKEDKKYHGFGMKSMKCVVEKYGGSMVVKTENDIFILQILLQKQAKKESLNLK